MVLTAGVVTAVGAIVINSPTSAAAIILTAVLLLGGTFVRSRRSGREQLEVAERRHEGERAAMLGGHLEARPAPNGEFLLTAALPIGSDPEDGP